MTEQAISEALKRIESLRLEVSLLPSGHEPQMEIESNLSIRRELIGRLLDGIEDCINHNPAKNALPCPFCGSPAKLYNTQMGGFIGVCCSTNKCGITMLGPHGKTIEEVIKIWNKRWSPNDNKK